MAKQEINGKFSNLNRNFEVYALTTYITGKITVKASVLHLLDNVMCAYFPKYDTHKQFRNSLSNYQNRPKYNRESM